MYARVWWKLEGTVFLSVVVVVVGLPFSLLYCVSCMYQVFHFFGRKVLLSSLRRVPAETSVVFIFGERQHKEGT